MSEFINLPQSRPDDRYGEFEKIIKDNFNSLVDKNTPLFVTDAENLWDVYLDNIKGEDARSHYNCNVCKSLINRYGSLVTINETGDMESVLWNINVPPFFEDSVNALNNAVLNSRIKSVFISDERILGTPKTGAWTHLAVKLPIEKVNKSRLLSAGQIMAEKREDYRMLSRALQEYSTSTITQALDLLNTETLYRGDNVLGIAKWFKEIKELISILNNSKQIENIKWLAVATAPTGFCHIKSSMIGTLLDDIQDGLDYNSIQRRFKEKMNPANYMRSQSAPTVNHVQEAEKIVEKMGIANSLLRRYASIDEIPEFIWKNRYNKSAISSKTGGVFGNIQTRDKVQKQTNIDLPLTVMTWEKFVRTVLPNAENIEAKVDNSNRLMALITASDETSENILQWNNTFSWYYHGGIDGEIKKRVEQAGGKYENNEIRCSLIWENYTDLDLHCYTPRDRHIFFGDKRFDNGWLDVDMNAGSGRTLKPVENIRFESGALEGRYKFKVHNYSDRNNGDNPYKVELEINGQVYTCEGNANRNYDEVAFEFDYIKGQAPRMIRGGANSVSTSSNWNLSNEFVKVNAITTSPNVWGDNKVTRAGEHIFFLLDGCKDLSEGKGRGFFNEMLKSEFREIRKVLESYTASTPIENIEDATACGLGFNKDSEWNLTLKVTSNGSTRLIKIDRLD